MHKVGSVIDDIGLLIARIVIKIYVCVEIQQIFNHFTGQLCVMQEVCIADAAALSRLLPAEPCLAEGCNCQSDGDCPGENGR